MVLTIYTPVWSKKRCENELVWGFVFCFRTPPDGIERWIFEGWVPFTRFGAGLLYRFAN